MAENYGLCLVGVMDRLWFHHITLFPEPCALDFSETPYNTSLAISESSAYSSTTKTQTPSVPEEEISSATDAITPPQDDECKNKNSEKETTPKERPTRLNLQANKTRSHSSAPILHKRAKMLYSPGTMRLQKTMSCKSLWELELEEVKGFMDLGFRFDKKHLTMRMMRVIPGLQRLEQHNKDEIHILNHKNEGTKDDEVEDNKNEEQDNDGDDDEEKRGIVRPYLSEAWLTKRPNSPLLNWRVPRASAAADMKKHLKYWARTVATVIQQES